jgi:hypothetical protein
MTTRLRFVSALVLTLCAAGSAQAAEQAQKGSFRGTGRFQEKINFKNPALAGNGVERRGGASLAFDLSKGHLQLDMIRPGEPKWSQGFVVKSDTTDDRGVRTIAFTRPEASSPLAKQNRKALNGGMLQRLLGGYKSLEGGGELKIDGDKATLTNEGTAKVRAGLVTRDASWSERFVGTSTR